MESLNYAFDGSRALLFTDDTDFSIDGAMKIKHMLKKWDVEEDAVGNMGFMDPLLPNSVKRPSLSDRFLGKSAAMEFGARKELIDNSMLSPPEPSVSVKRSRITNVQSPVPTCQVYGCNKDLSSSKDYHKRHKVCDVHSKTRVVVVNGIHQRFCQQCSRFHKLAEFDEGKRSCRKRLAGHNERRRKPQFDTHLGSTYFSTDASKTSLIFSRILAGSFVGLQYNEPSNCPLSSVDEFCVSSDSGSVRSLLSARPRITEGISVRHANNICTLATPLGEMCTSENMRPFIPQQVNGLKVEEGRNSVNLVELSLHLQRVEQQKYYGGQIKLENSIFCD